MSTIGALPKTAIQCIGSFLDVKSRCKARLSCKLFDEIHGGCTEHTIYIDLHTLHTFNTRCNTAATLMPCLKKVTLVFKNLVGVHPISSEALDKFPSNTNIEIAFEYCDEEFTTFILRLPWKVSFAFIWFHNGTETPVNDELKEAIKTRGLPFSSRFNSKQAMSLLKDERIVPLMSNAVYVVQSNHFQTQYGFLEPAHVIHIPQCIPRVQLELFHYNVIVEHPENVNYISFCAHDFNENDLIGSNRDRLCSWFNADRLKDGRLDEIDIYTLSFAQSHSRTACFASHMFETLRTLKSRAIVRIYNCVQCQCMALLQEYPDIFVVIVCKTDHTYLIGHLVKCFLKRSRSRLCVVTDDAYHPRDEWANLNLDNPLDIYSILPPLLKHEWFWVQFTKKDIVTQVNGMSIIRNGKLPSNSGNGINP